MGASSGDDGQVEAPDRSPAGIDPDGVSRWFADHIRQARPPLRFSLIAGGRSNLTFKVSDADGRTFALRRPPVSHVLPTAHDMAREHRLIHALGPTPVPVPETYGLCRDEAVSGAPFYVMEFVEGHILRDASDVEAAFPPPARHSIGENLADTLAALHAVDVDEVGLGDLARRDGYIERQVRRWTRQYQDSKLGELESDGLVEEVGRRLSADIPSQRDTAIVHGDYRLDNVVLDDDGRVRAILDWEICTLGDPLADLGLLLVYWLEPAEGDPFLGLSATTAPGFPGRRAMAERYAAASGRDVSEVGYFMAFGYWKLACILQGVYVRYQAGAGAGDQGAVDSVPLTVRRLAEQAASSLSEVGR